MVRPWGPVGNIPDLSGLVPYTGATGDVDLGANDLTTNGLITGNGGFSSSALGFSMTLGPTGGFLGGEGMMMSHAGDSANAIIGPNFFNFANANGSQSIYGSDGNITGNGTITGNILASTVATGTAPLSITSTTLVSNLNADFLDGQHGNYYATASGYIPYTSGTSNVDLGIHNLTVDTNSLFVDSVNHRVGIGTATPTTKLQVYDDHTGGEYVDAKIGGTYGLYLDVSDPLDNMYGQALGINFSSPTNPGGNAIGIVSTSQILNGQSTGITGGDMILLTQDTSAFSGSGINMNFGVGAGSFTGRFFTGNLNYTNKFFIDYTGGAYFAGNVGIGTITPSGILSVTPLQYNTGSASQSVSTITGIGTAWTSAMIGSQFVFVDGTNAGTITAVGSGTSLTVSTSQTVAPTQTYTISYTGLQVNSTGNVGIGTTAPTAQLHLVKADSSALTDLLINPTTKTSGNLIDAQVGGVSKFSVDKDGYSNAQRLYYGGTGYIYNDGGYLGYASFSSGVKTNGRSLFFPPNTSYPAIELHSASTGAAALSLRDTTSDTIDQTVKIGAYSMKGANIITWSSGTNQGIVDFADTSLSKASAGALRIGDGAANANGSLLASQISLAKADSSTLTDLLINPTAKTSGNLIDAQVATVSKFSVTNAGVVQQAGCTTAGGLNADASGNIICTPSREQFKNDIVDLDGGLSNLLLLRPVSCTFKPEMNMGDGTHFGFISEEVAVITPEFATHDKDGKPYGLDTNAILSTTVKAIQEMNFNLEGIAGTIIPPPDSPAESFVAAFFNRMDAWMADTTNGIGDFFANRVHTQELCVTDVAGETCITRTELDTLLAGAGVSGGGSSNGGTSVATCSDGIQNQDEIGIDTGGVCAPVAPICNPPQTLVNNVCTDPVPVTPTCTPPQTLVDNTCADPAPAAPIPVAGGPTPTPTP